MSRFTQSVSVRFVAAILVIAATTAFALSGCLPETRKAPDDMVEARHAMMLRDFMAAEKSFERYLRRNPDGGHRWEAWENLVRLSLSVKHDNRAAIELLEAMRIEYADDMERQRQVIRQLGSLYQNTRRYEQALQLWIELAEDASASPEIRATAYKDLGEIYLRRLEFVLAKEALDKCLVQDVAGTIRGQCLYDRAQTWMAEGNLDEAKASLEAVIALDGVDDSLRSLSMFMLADALESEGKPEEAMAMFRQLVGVYPNAAVVEKRIELLEKAKAKPKK